MTIHYATATGETPQGLIVSAKSCSGNRRGNYSAICRLSRAQRRNAMIFINYLEELYRMNANRGGGKTAFTCAEPQAIIEVLLKGATFDSIRVKNIKCEGAVRTPCGAFCGTYLIPTANGIYRIQL